MACHHFSEDCLSNGCALLWCYQSIVDSQLFFKLPAFALISLAFDAFSQEIAECRIVVVSFCNFLHSVLGETVDNYSQTTWKLDCDNISCDTRSGFGRAWVCCAALTL